MGFLDEISGLFSNTESLFQSSDQKSDQPSMSVLNSVTGGAVHFARSAVVEGLSFIPGVGSYALLGKTFWSLYRGQYSESITNVEALISYLPFGALEQLATGAYSLFTGKSAATKKDVSRFEAALQMAFGAFGLACDVRGFKASKLKLGEFLNHETARLLNPFHSFSRVRVPHMEVAGVPGLRMGGFGDEVEDLISRFRNLFSLGGSRYAYSSGMVVEEFPIDFKRYSIWNERLSSFRFKEYEKMPGHFVSEGFGVAVITNGKGKLINGGLIYCSRIIMHDPTAKIIVDSHLPIEAKDLEVFNEDFTRLVSVLKGKGFNFNKAKITVIYGDEIGGNPGLKVAALLTERHKLTVSVMPAGYSEFHPLDLETGQIGESVFG